MKYYLINMKQNEVVDTVDLQSDVGVSGARTYFVLRKQIESEKFDQIWKVSTEKPLRRGVEWWKEDKEITDSELKY